MKILFMNFLFFYQEVVDKVGSVILGLKILVDFCNNIKD